MFKESVYIWKKAPFVRFILPLMAGIIFQWYISFPLQLAWGVFALSVLLSTTYFILSDFNRYRRAAISGISVSLLFFALGTLLVWYQDIRHDPAWYGSNYSTGNAVLVILKEPPIEKANSYKALANVIAVGNKKNTCAGSNGDILIYFEKDSTLKQLDFGSQLVFSKPIQEIKSAGNPGGFDYRRYCLFQGITHQVYLKEGDYVLLKETKKPIFGKILFAIRRKVLRVLRKYINGPKELGLAEALLIGYKDDLDKNLVQSYTNTGVVHVIAISGLHLGLIYWLLVLLLKPLRKIPAFKWLVPVLIISGLWLFSLLAGGQPSVLRSAVMFTCIVLAESLTRKTSIFNTLSLSAFLLLCINPFWLWDVGFQLSYSAILSIVIFMKPIYNLFFIKNKLLDIIWKLNAVSIAAQVLTTPLSIYHFHQFPDYFLLTNFIAVPLSSAIVLGELFLCVLYFIPFFSVFTGKILSWLIWIMNSYIERIGGLPFSLWGGMQVSSAGAILLFVIVGGVAWWLLGKKRVGAWLAALAFLFFAILRSHSFYECYNQQKIIVYNTPKCRAIDILIGRHYFFMGDSSLLADDFAMNFNVKPSRILHRVVSFVEPPAFAHNEHYFQVGATMILLIDKNIAFDTSSEKIAIDILVVSRAQKLRLATLTRTFTIRQVVFDGSVPPWKIRSCARDCDSLHIPFHDVYSKGAFEMNLN